MPRRTSRGIVWFLRPCESLNTARSEEHTSELQSRSDLVCRLLLEKKNEEVRGGRGGADVTHGRDWSAHSPQPSCAAQRFRGRNGRQEQPAMSVARRLCIATYDVVS